MADQIIFKIPTENICREISNKHHLRFIISDSLYRSQPPIIINNFTQPKKTHNVQGDGHCTYHAVCYAISGSEISFIKSNNWQLMKFMKTAKNTNLFLMTGWMYSNVKLDH